MRKQYNFLKMHGFSLILRETPGGTHENHDFFRTKSKKSKRNDFGIYFMCNLENLVFGYPKRRGLTVGLKKNHSQNPISLCRDKISTI